MYVSFYLLFCHRFARDDFKCAYDNQQRLDPFPEAIFAQKRCCSGRFFPHMTVEMPKAEFDVKGNISATGSIMDGAGNSNHHSH